MELLNLVAHIGRNGRQSEATGTSLETHVTQPTKTVYMATKTDLGEQHIFAVRSEEDAAIMRNQLADVRKSLAT